MGIPCTHWVTIWAIISSIITLPPSDCFIPSENDAWRLTIRFPHLTHGAARLRDDADQRDNVRIERDLSHFKNRFSESQVADETAAMAMGFTLVRVLSNSDLIQMCQRLGVRSVAQNDLISFACADLVLEVSDQEGNRQFIAVEISYTADLRDTDRARRLLPHRRMLPKL